MNSNVTAGVLMLLILLIGMVAGAFLLAALVAQVLTRIIP